MSLYVDLVDRPCRPTSQSHLSRRDPGPGGLVTRVNSPSHPFPLFTLDTTSSSRLNRLRQLLPRTCPTVVSTKKARDRTRRNLSVLHRGLQTHETSRQRPESPQAYRAARLSILYPPPQALIALRHVSGSPAGVAASHPLYAPSAGSLHSHRRARSAPPHAEHQGPHTCTILPSTLTVDLPDTCRSDE